MAGCWLRVAPVVSVLLLGAACADGKTPFPGPTTPTPGPPTAAPSPVAPPTTYNGAWSGTFTITACVGRRHCAQGIGSQQPFVLRLSQAGDRVTGVFQTEERPFQAGAFVVPVEGDISATGRISLRGVRPSLGFNSPTIELTFASANDEFTQAELAYEARYPGAPYNPSDSSFQSLAGFVTRAVRGAVTPQTSFEGTWRGEARIRDCSAVGTRYCLPDDKDEEYPVTLVLTQNGDRVSGTFTFRMHSLNVTGSVGGHTLTLDTAETDERNSSGGSWFRLERCALTRDLAGHLTGTFHHVRNYAGHVSRYDSDIAAVLTP